MLNVLLCGILLLDNVLLLLQSTEPFMKCISAISEFVYLFAFVTKTTQFDCHTHPPKNKNSVILVP
jgi:hypothetical protein